MSVQFRIRGKDILRLQSALDRDEHPEPEKRWNIFLEVTPVVAIFQFGKSSVEYPVDGRSPGFAKFSEEIFRQATIAFPIRNPPREVSIEIREGYFLCDEGHAKGAIDIGYFRHPNSDRAVYLRDVELTALGSLLADTTVQGVDLQPHIAEASQSISSSISFAYGHLEHCGFEYEEVRELVQVRIAKMGPRIKEQFGSLGVTAWKS